MTPQRRGRKAPQQQQTGQIAEVTPLRVPLHWADIEAKEFVFANEIFARFQSGAYWLTFGQVHGTYQVEPDVDQLQKEGIFARPVAKIVVTPERLADFLVKLSGLYERMSKGQNPPERGAR